MKFRFSPHIAVQIRNLKRAKIFYTEVLGMETLSINKKEIKLHSTGITFYLEQSSNRQVFFSFEVDSINDAREILVENNCQITMETAEGIMVKDPFGLSYFVSESK